MASENQPTLLLDVDGTIAAQGAAGKLNINLIKMLKLFDFNNNTSFLTRSLIKEEPEFNGVLRNTLINDLLTHQITVNKVYTAYDDFDSNLSPGDVYNSYIKPIEDALVILNGTPPFSGAMRTKFMREFRAYYQNNKQLPVDDLLNDFIFQNNSDPSIKNTEPYFKGDPDTRKKLSVFLEANKKAWEWLKDKPELSKEEAAKAKARVRNLIESDNVIFIDDSQTERTNYTAYDNSQQEQGNHHKNDLVLAPPHCEGFRQEHNYLSCAEFMQKIIQRTGQFPINNDNIIADLLYFSDEDAKLDSNGDVYFPADALTLLKIAFVVAKHQNKPEEIINDIKNKVIQFALLHPELPHDTTLNGYELEEFSSESLKEINEAAAIAIAVKPLQESLQALKTTLASAFNPGIFASIKRFFGVSEPKTIRDEALNAIESINNDLLATSPNPAVRAESIRLFNALKNQCLSSDIQASLTTMTPVPNTPAMIKGMILDNLQQKQFKTGLYGLTGVKSQQGVKIPKGVDEILKAVEENKPIADIKNIASTALKRNGFFRDKSTEVFYKKVVETQKSAEETPKSNPPS